MKTALTVATTTTTAVGVHHHSKKSRKKGDLWAWQKRLNIW